MSRVVVSPDTAYHLINHGPCCLITTGDGTRRNVAPINWTMPVNNDPPLVASAIEQGIMTHDLIRATGEFVVNVVGADWMSQILYCGRHHGAEGEKFQAAGLTPVPCRALAAPRLAEACAHLECRVEDSKDCDGVTLFIARILHAEADSACFDGKALVPEKARTVHHLGGRSFAVTDRTWIAPPSR